MSERGIKCLTISALTHFFLFILLGFAALSMEKSENDEKIYEVSLLDFSDGSNIESVSETTEETFFQDTEDLSEEALEESVLPAEDNNFSRPVKRKKNPTPKKSQSVAPTSTQSQTDGQSASASESQSDTIGESSQGSPAEEVFTPPPATNSIVSPATPPAVISATTPEYPYSAMQNGDEGTVVVRILLNKSGGVDDVSISQSSGHGSLDRAAINAAKRMRFTPGLDSYGRPVRCYVYKPFRFALQ